MAFDNEKGIESNIPEAARYFKMASDLGYNCSSRSLLSLILMPIG